MIDNTIEKCSELNDCEQIILITIIFETIANLFLYDVGLYLH